MMKNKLFVVGAMVLVLGRSSMGADMCAAAGSMSGAAEATFTGIVLATTNASRYTYVQVKNDKGTIWAAGPVFDVKVGDRVTVEGGMTAKNFTSKTLNRKFDELYLAGSITQAGNETPSHAETAGKLPAGHPAISGKAEATSGVIPPIQKPAGGKTVAEVWSGKAALAGKTVIVRAKVVKVSTNILGMNWLHLRDGSGAEGENDLTVTTKEDVKPGDVVTLSGTINTNKDFGAGYSYEVIMQEATVVTK